MRGWYGTTLVHAWVHIFCSHAVGHLLSSLINNHDNIYKQRAVKHCSKLNKLRCFVVGVRWNNGILYTIRGAVPAGVVHVSRWVGRDMVGSRSYFICALLSFRCSLFYLHSSHISLVKFFITVPDASVWTAFGREFHILIGSVLQCKVMFVHLIIDR